MGLFDRKKEGGIMDVIRCDESEYLVWKWRPSGEACSTKKENSIRYGSSLRVKSGELAVFVYEQKDGQVMDYLVGPYDGTIKTANFPVLTSIVGAAFGGNSPFQAEIYFINIQGNNKIKFAVPYFDVSDPRLPDHPVPVSVRGTLIFSLDDYKRFISLNRLIDFDLDSFHHQIKDALTRKIKSIVANIPFDYELSLIQIERKTDMIAEILEEKLKDRLEEFGVTMKHIDVSAIEIDKESEEYLEVKSLTAGILADTRRAQSEVNIKNLYETQQTNSENVSETLRIQREEAQRAQRLQTESNFMGAHALDQQTDVLKTAAGSLGQMNMDLSSGSSGGEFNPAGLMMGMSLGGAMGGQISNMLGQMGQQIHNSSMTPPPIPQVQYHLAHNGNQSGPYNVQQLANLVTSGQMTEQTYVWKEGMAGWELAGNVAELSGLFSKGSVPPPPPPPVGPGTPPAV